jgi:cytochrome c
MPCLRLGVDIENVDRGEVDNMRYRSLGLLLLSLLLTSITEAHADDVSKGRDLFIRYCVACHAFACNKEQYYSGPKLGGLFGRKAAGVEDYDGYSEGLKNSEITWTDQTLDVYLADPARIDPDSVMAIEGIADDVRRQQMIAFLKTEDPTVNLCS